MPAMAARQRGAAVRQPWKATARLSEECTRTMVNTWIYYGYLDDVRCSDMLRPHARWHRGESAAARVAVFRAGEATSHGNIMTQANTHPNQALT